MLLSSFKKVSWFASRSTFRVSFIRCLGLFTWSDFVNRTPQIGKWSLIPAFISFAEINGFGVDVINKSNNVLEVSVVRVGSQHNNKYFSIFRLLWIDQLFVIFTWIFKKYKLHNSFFGYVTTDRAACEFIQLFYSKLVLLLTVGMRLKRKTTLFYFRFSHLLYLFWWFSVYGIYFSLITFIKTLQVEVRKILFFFMHRMFN